jgi:hypothetical protein
MGKATMHNGWLMLNGTLLLLGGAFLFAFASHEVFRIGGGVVAVYGAVLHLYGLLRGFI